MGRAQRNPSTKCARTPVLSVPRDPALGSPPNREGNRHGVRHLPRFPSLPGRAHAEAFAQSFELVDTAERWGLDAMWLGELHFIPARSVLSAPLSIASAIAARTQRMKIGLAVQVLPLCHPLRLAEEAATVDQISNGRLIFGVGRSGVARTYEAYGVPYARKPRAVRRGARHRQKAWTQDTVSYQGKFHRFEDVTVVPKPYQQPTPPIRVAATSADTFVSIGRQGLPIFVAVRYETAAGIAPSVARLPRGARVSGDPQPAVCSCASRPISRHRCAGTHRGGTELIHFYRQQAALLADSASAPAWTVPIVAPQTARRLETMTYEDALKGTVLIGSPDSVAERLEECDRNWASTAC